MKRIYLNIFTALSFISFSAIAENDALNLTASGSTVHTTAAPLSGNAVCTFELWFNGTDATDYARLISFDNYAFEIAGSKGRIAIYDGAWYNTVSNTSTGWHHVAVSRNTDTTKVYVDGVKVYQKASAVRDFTSQIMYLGLNGKTKSDGKLPVKIDEVRIWSTVRTAQEIITNYKKQLIGSETGLASYYQFNKNSYSDKTESGNTLVPTGTVSFENTGFGSYLNDYSLNFDGTNDIASIAAFVTGNASFTYEAQFKTTSTAGYGRIFANTNYGFDVALLNGSIRVYTGSWRTITSSGLNDGKWHHLAVTKDGSTLTVYLNGAQVGQLSNVSLNIAGSFAIGGPIGGGNTTASDFFNGDLDEVRIWSTARTQPEIAANVGKELIGNEVGLLAYYDMNTPATPVYDVTSNFKDLARSGSTGLNVNPQFVATTGKQDILTGLFEDNSSTIAISLFPNPAKNKLTISSPITFEKTQIMNMNGTVVEEYVHHGNVLTINIESLQPSIYILRIQAENGSSSMKFIKE